MKSRIVRVVLTVIGIFALGATTAHAGGGAGAAVPLSNFFVCHGINGGDQGVKVDIHTDELGTDPLLGVRVGSGVLGCTQVRLTNAGVPLSNETELTPTPGLYLKCYTISVPRRPAGPPASTPTAYAVTDFFEDSDTVVASEIRYLCGPGNFLTQ